MKYIRYITLIMVFCLMVNTCISSSSFGLDSHYSSEKKSIQPGKESSLEILAAKGIINDKNYRIREEIRSNSEVFLDTRVSFSEEMSKIIGNHKSIKEALQDEKVTKDVLSLLKETEDADKMLGSTDDFDMFNKLYTEANAKLYSDKESFSYIDDIVVIMDSIVFDSNLIPQPSLAGNLKAIMIEDEKVILRWQHDAKWIPEYGYNLYRIVNEEAHLLQSSIGSVDNVTNNLDHYASKISTDNTSIADVDKIEYKNVLKEGFEFVLEDTLITNEKAKILGFKSVEDFNTFSDENIKLERELLTVIKGNETFSIDRAGSFIDPLKPTYDEEKLGLGTVLKGKEISEKINSDMELSQFIQNSKATSLTSTLMKKSKDISTLSYNKGDYKKAIHHPKKSKANDVKIDNSKKGKVNDVALSVSPNAKNIQQSQEELQKIVDARSLLSSGSDLDFDLATTMGLGYVDHLNGVDAKYAAYVLLPVYEREDIYDLEILSKEAIEYALDTGLLIEEGTTEEVQIYEKVDTKAKDPAFSMAVVEIPSQTPLLPPSDIEGYGINNSSVLRWNALDDEVSKNIISGYNIYRKINNESEFTKVNKEPVLIPYYTRNVEDRLLTFESSVFYRDTEIKNGDKVEYKVESIDIFGRASGLSESSLVIDSVIKTTLPEMPIIEQPYLSSKVKGDKVQEWLKNAVKQTNKNAPSVILPISNTGTDDVVLFNVYRSEAYGKGKFSTPEKVSTIEAIGKSLRIDRYVNNKGEEVSFNAIEGYNNKKIDTNNSNQLITELDEKLNKGELKIEYLPGTYYKDTDIERGHYYKYWVASVDSWGNESAWTPDVTIGYEENSYNGEISSANIEVVENVRLNTSDILPGFMTNRVQSQNDRFQLNEAVQNVVASGGIAQNNQNSSRFIDRVNGREANSVAEINGYGVSSDELNTTNGIVIDAIANCIEYGTTLTESTVVDSVELPKIISPVYLNLPDVNQIQYMLGFNRNDFNIDGSVNVAWERYQGGNLKEYAVYRGIISDRSFDSLNEMSKAEVLEAMSSCELIAETNMNVLTDTPTGISENDIVIYVVTLVPEDAERVTIYSNLNDVRDDHAVGGWVKLTWLKPIDSMQVKGYKIYKAVLNDFEGYDTVDKSSLDWQLIENNCEYAYYFESVDQVKEQFLAYKIVPVSIWGDEGKPIYKNIRVPALLPPAMPQMLMPYAKPGKVEVRFTAVDDAKEYTVYRATVKKISNGLISSLLSDRTSNGVFGTDASGVLFENNIGPNSPLFDINPNITLERAVDTVFIDNANSSDTLTRENLLTYKQITDASDVVNNIVEMERQEKEEMLKHVIDEYGVLSVADYSDLSWQLAATVGWDEIATIDANSVGNPGEVITYLDDSTIFGEEYYYSVTASNTDHESYKPEPIKGYCRKAEPFDAPENVTVENSINVVDDDRKYWYANITWDHVTMNGFTQEEVIEDYLVGYIVYRSAELDGDYYQVSNVIKDNSYLDITAYAYQKYYYKVKAIDIAGLLSEFSDASNQSAEILSNVDIMKIGKMKAIESGSLMKVYMVEPNQPNINIKSEHEKLEEDLQNALKNASDEQIRDFLTEIENNESISEDLKEDSIKIINEKLNGKPKKSKTSYLMDVEANYLYGSLGNIPFNIPDNTPVNIPDVTPINSTDNIELGDVPSLEERIINTDFQNTLRQQTEILGYEPEVASFEIEGGWVEMDDFSTTPEVRVNRMTQHAGLPPDLANALRAQQISDEIALTHCFQIGDYLIEDIPAYTVKKDGVHGTAITGRGNIYLGESRVKVPVIFKKYGSQDLNEEHLDDEIKLAMYPYKSITTGLFISDMDIIIDERSVDTGKISGSIEHHDGGNLLPDLKRVYFEDASINERGQITVSNHAFPAFRYDDYYVRDVDYAMINLDHMNNTYEGTYGYQSYNAREFPISLCNGKVETSFGFPTVDNKGLELSFNNLGIIPYNNHAPNRTRDREIAMEQLEDSIRRYRDYNDLEGDYEGLYGEIYLEETDEPTTTRFIVPAGISVRADESRLMLFGKKTISRLTELKGEVLLPFFDAPDEFLGIGDGEHLTREDVDGISGTIISLYDEGSDFPDIYLDEMILNVFDRVKNGGLVVIGGNTYGLSTVPFDIEGEDIDDGFILEHVELEPTMVGNYNINNGVVEDFIHWQDTGNRNTAELFTKLVEQSMVVQSEDASIDLSTTERTSTAPLNTWYSGVEWKGIILDEGSVGISPAIVKLKEGDGDGTPITFDLEPKEMIYDRNGFMYQNEVVVQEGETVAIEFGRLFGGFSDAKLHGLTIDMYNNKFDFNMKGTVLIKSFLNEEFQFRMQTEEIDNEKVVTAHLLPKSIDISRGKIKIDGVSSEVSRVAMDIYGGYFDEEGVHIDGALKIGALSEESLDFSELIIPAKQEEITTTRDSLSQGEALRKGTALFSKPHVVCFNGFDIELAYFDIYTILDKFRFSRDVLGDRQAIYYSDIKIYGSTALAENMEKKSKERNASLYIEDIHGLGKFDYDRCIVHVKIPTGKDGVIAGEVKAKPSQEEGILDGYSKLCDALGDAKDANAQALETAGNAQMIMRDAEDLLTELSGLTSDVNNIDVFIKERGKTLVVDKIPDLILDKDATKAIIMREARIIIDEANEIIGEYNDKAYEFETYIEQMLTPPETYQGIRFERVDIINKSQYTGFFEKLLRELENQISLGAEELIDYLDDYRFEFGETGDIHIPEIDINLGEFGISNIITASGGNNIFEDTEETLGNTKDVFSDIGEGLDTLDRLFNNGIPPGMEVGEDGIVEFVATGDDVFKMAFSELGDFLEGTNVNAIGRFGYQLDVRDEEKEDMYFYVFGVGYIATPNDPDASLWLGLIELQNLVAITGYNMVLPYSSHGGYEVGYGEDLFNSVKTLKIDENNNKKDFFIASGDAFILSSRQSHIAALKKLRYISESDGSFEMSGELWGPKDLVQLAVPTPNNSEKVYGGARISYNARDNGYKLLTLVDNIPIEPTCNFKVGGNIGFDWADDYWAFRMGYPEDMHLIFAPLDLEGGFGMMVGSNPYSNNPVFSVKMGLDFNKSFNYKIVYANVGAGFKGELGYRYWNLDKEALEFAWYEDGKAFEGIGAYLKLYGYMNGGINAGRFGKRDIISATLDCTADLVNPREDILYKINNDTGDYIAVEARDTNGRKISDKSTWYLYAGIRIKYNLDLWACSYSDNFMYDLRMDF